MKIINHFRKHEKYVGIKLVYVKSQHQEDHIIDVFPKLKDLEWLEFISWKEYDSIKKDNYEYNINYEFDSIDFIELRPFIKKYFIFNSKYNSLLDKYDTKNGIAIHMRYGDKLQINKELLKHNQLPKYTVMKLKYYEDHAYRFLENKKGPVYIFTDSPSIKLNIPNSIYVNENTSETLFLLTKFKRSVISDSSLSIAAGYMNFSKHITIAPAYKLRLSDSKIIRAKYIDERVFQLETDKDYILSNNEMKKFAL